jgi:hypothetical protein
MRTGSIFFGQFLRCVNGCLYCIENGFVVLQLLPTFVTDAIYYNCLHVYT